MVIESGVRARVRVTQSSKCRGTRAYMYSALVTVIKGRKLWK